MTAVPSAAGQRRQYGRWTVIAVGFALGAPLLILPIEAFANEWRAPALIPQRFGTRALDRIANDNVLPEAIANSFVIGLVAVTLGMFLAWPAARSLVEVAPMGANERGLRRWLLIAIVAPLLIPPLVIGEGLQVWFLRLGLSDTILGVALSHLVFVVPYMVIILRPGFTTDLLAQEEAALGLAASRWHVFRFVTAGGMAAPFALALAMGFTVSWSQYGTSLGVGGGIPTLPIVLVPFVGSDPQIAALLDLIFMVPPLIALTIALRTDQRL